MSFVNSFYLGVGDDSFPQRVLHLAFAPTCEYSYTSVVPDGKLSSPTSW